MFFKPASQSDKAIVDALNRSQAVIEFTPSGLILVANNNFLATVGYAMDEIEGRHHRLFCDAAYAASDDYRRFWQDLAAGRFSTGSFKRFGKDGKVVWLQASYNPIVDASGRVVKIIKFASDITQQKLREIDLNGKVDAIGRSQAVIEFTPDGIVIGANANFCAFTGYGLDEVVGKHHRMFCDPAYVASPEYEAFWQALRRGEFTSAEYRRLVKGGREVFIQATYNPVFDDTGTLVKVVKFATDITARVRKRLRCAELNIELGAVVERITGAHVQAAQASTASTETGAIINSVAAASEELSQSVRDISNNMGMAKESVVGVFRHSENANRSAESLNRSAAAMTNIVTLIQNIAGQINLLALNATIESARAGEAGKGFAVVASEVKTLANQAASSTKTISAEIASMQSVTNEVVSALDLISTSMTTVLENVSSVAATLEQQDAVAHEITGNMHAAVSAVGEINESLDTMSRTFGEVAEASAGVKHEMEALDAA